MTEETGDKKAKVRRQDSNGAGRRVLLVPGSFRILCSPGNSPEYIQFLSSFCNAYQNQGNSDDLKGIGYEEINAVVQNIAQRGSKTENVLARELQAAVIIARNDDHKTLFFEAGAIEIVVSAMKRHVSSPEVQIFAFKCLINLGKSYETRFAIGNCGGIAAIVEAMSEYKDLDEVQEVGIWAMGSVVTANTENKVIAADVGGIEAVVEAMKKYPGNQQVQQVGLWTIGSLSANWIDNAIRIGRKGGVTHAITIMKNFVDNPNIQEMGCWALACMAAGGGKPAEYIVKKEGHQAVMAAMKKYEKNASLQYAGLVALVHLGSETALAKLFSLPTFALFQ